ncbi:MAG: sulfotransferase family protein [Acidimicrobiales bacterium]
MDVIDLRAVEEAAATAPVFLVGCARSGTTLLQLMLDAHPSLTVTHECSFVTDIAFDPQVGNWTLDEAVSRIFAHETFDRLQVDADTCVQVLDKCAPSTIAEVLRLLFATRAVSQDKCRWGNKTPSNVFHLERIAKLFPDSKLVHIIRDGRDSAASWATLRSQGSVGLPLLPSALIWQQVVKRGRMAGEGMGGDRYLEVHFEQLIASTPDTLKLICDFIDLEFDTGMLTSHETAIDRLPAGMRSRHENVSRPPTTGLRDWKEGFSPRDIRAAEALLRRTLIEFGYSVEDKSESRLEEVVDLSRGYVLGGVGATWYHRAGVRRELTRRAQDILGRSRRGAAAS